MFVRYAYPPNALGYCGPDDFAAFREYAVAGVVDQGLVQLAQAFSGAWPYLELISAGCGISDPLDHRVVEAYWVGNDLLDRVPVTEIGDSMADRFRQRVGSKFQFLAEGVLAGGVPHHSFHVFGVYPWVGLLGDDRKASHALMVLDRCRIRWGKVTAVHGDQATVEYRPLCWDGRLLTLGEPAQETARLALDGTVIAGGLARDIGPGDVVSLHWDWICDRLTQRQLRALRTYTLRHLDMVNHRVEHPGPLAVLGYEVPDSGNPWLRQRIEKNQYVATFMKSAPARGRALCRNCEVWARPVGIRDQAGVTTNWRRYRSRKVTGPRGPGTASMLIPVSGTENSLKPSSRRVVEFQNAPVPAYAPRNSSAAARSSVTIAAASPEVSSLASTAAARGPSAGATVTVASWPASSAHS